MLWIILTFPARCFSHVENATGSTRHCRHCTLGCIAYSRLLCRFSLLRPLSRVPGTQSRRPISLNGPRPFRHLQLRYFTENENGCEIWWRCIDAFEMVDSCPHVAVVVVLVCPYFMSLRCILCLSPSWCPHNPVFTTTCCKCCCCTDSRTIFVQFENSGSSWNFWELAIGERGQLEVKNEKKTCPWFIWSRLSHRLAAVLETLEQDYGDIKTVVTKHV